MMVVCYFNHTYHDAPFAAMLENPRGRMKLDTACHDSPQFYPKKERQSLKALTAASYHLLSLQKILRTKNSLQKTVFSNRPTHWWVVTQQLVRFYLLKCVQLGTMHERFQMLNLTCTQQLDRIFTYKTFQLTFEHSSPPYTSPLLLGDAPADVLLDPGNSKDDIGLAGSGGLCL